MLLPPWDNFAQVVDKVIHF